MGAETLVIRKANLTDLERLAELEAESFEWAWDEQMLMEHMFREFVHYFVAEINGKIIGYICGLLVAGEAEIHRVCVAKIYRGKRYGIFLLSKFEEICCGENIKKIFLEVREENEIAIKMYLATGYKFAGKRKNYYGVGRDGLLMLKTLA